MNAEKTGNLIRSLRIKKGLTQKELAQMICVTDKAVCKWEKGRGCPNITLISQLSKVLEVDIQSILQGYLDKNKKIGENMNHLKFYKCPTCGNLVTSIKSVELSCCSNKLSPVSAQTRSDPEYQPVIQEFDGQYSIKFNHPMTKSNYISQVIVVRYDQIMTVNLYAESEAIITIPQVRGIRLFVITNKSELIAVTV